MLVVSTILFFVFLVLAVLSFLARGFRTRPFEGVTLKSLFATEISSFRNQKGNRDGTADTSASGSIHAAWPLP